MVDGRSGIDRWTSVLGRRSNGRAVIGLDILVELVGFSKMVWVLVEHTECVCWVNVGLRASGNLMIAEEIMRE